ncbi:hypothetical protein DY000_02012870 [Brassica cretica]|uniref:Uncharacterized protein n=1 Tax=Brassica cretica TaxID=69181 RepID=A0ABQ7CMD0_BRACR|nr:hypothetical protein DY000_02012870 [Brassica cretica]
MVQISEIPDSAAILDKDDLLVVKISEIPDSAAILDKDDLLVVKVHLRKILM